MRSITIVAILFCSISLRAQIRIPGPGGAASSGTGSLMGSETTTVPTTTFPGSNSDWRTWGYDNGVGGCPGDNYDASSGTSVSTYSLIGGLTTGNVEETTVGSGFTWTGGTPAGSATDNATACRITTPSSGMGFQVTTPCGTASHTANFWSYNNATSVVFTAHLSDSSASDYTYTMTTGSDYQFTMVYNCASNGNTLQMKIVYGSGSWTSIKAVSYQ